MCKLLYLNNEMDCNNNQNQNYKVADPDAGTITTDLGCKGISSDLLLEERAFLLGHNTAELVSQSEEHGVFRIKGKLPHVGDYLLAVPGHICPTTIRYPGIHVIDTSGNVVDYYLHTARDRL